MRNKNYTSFEYEEQEREKMNRLYDITFPEDTGNFVGKDIESNTSVDVRVIKVDNEKEIVIAETRYGQSIVIDLKKERKGMKRFGHSELNINPGDSIELVVYKEKNGNFSGSVSAGYEKILKRELHRSVKEENCAFHVKVTSVCNGGFMVDLSGIVCFLPGSLAAANRIMNFADYIGKELTVMTEIYDQKRDIFVVSFKKYLKKIIDSKAQELSFSNKYEGTVTGVSGNIVFVEWDEIFTGIINFDESEISKISDYKSGDKVSFYVIDIKNPQRIAISLTEPNHKMKSLQDLKDSSLEKVGEDTETQSYKAEITKLKTFGAFVKLENGLNGLIEKEKLRFSMDQYEVGQSLECFISSVDLSNLKIQLVEK